MLQPDLSTWDNSNCKWNFFFFSYLKIFATVINDTVKKVWKKKTKEEYFMICENCMKFRFQCPYIKFYWKTTMLIHFYVVYGCFCITAAELNCDRDFMSCQAWNINFLVIYRKSLSISIQTNSNGTQFSVDQSVTKLQIIIVFEFILQGWVPGNSWSKERKIKIHLINSPE